MRALALVLAASASLAAPAFAQTTEAQPPSDRAQTIQAMQRMNRDMMAAPVTGDPDRDFTATMIPHHEGAIEMARIYLRDGRDPQMRKLAESIVADQEREIGVMRAWQASHPAPPDGAIK